MQEDKESRNGHTILTNRKDETGHAALHKNAVSKVVVPQSVHKASVRASLLQHANMPIFFSCRFACKEACRPWSKTSSIIQHHTHPVNASILLKLINRSPKKTDMCPWGSDITGQRDRSNRQLLSSPLSFVLKQNLESTMNYMVPSSHFLGKCLFPLFLSQATRWKLVLEWRVDRV